jgi:hypothetical protein
VRISYSKLNGARLHPLDKSTLQERLAKLSDQSAVERISSLYFGWNARTTQEGTHRSAR